MFRLTKFNEVKLTQGEKFEYERRLFNEWCETCSKSALWNLGEFGKWRKEKLKELGRPVKWGG